MADAFNFDYGCVEICNNEYREKNAAFSCTVSEWKYLKRSVRMSIRGPIHYCFARRKAP